MFHSIHGSVVGIIQIAAAGNSVSIFLDKFVVICCLVVVVYVTPASRYLTYPSLHVCRFALCMSPAEVQFTILIHVCFDLLLVLYMNPASVKSPFFVMFVSICCILGCV
jgi:hypothetical protein